MASWLVAGSSHAASGVFYVSPQGNDSWTGTLAEPNAAGTDGPLASVHRAVEAARTWRETARGVRPERPVVEIRGGMYPLAAPLHLTPRDSGLIVRAFRDEQPILSGGVSIRDWRVENGAWRASLPGVREGSWHFTQLFVNDQRRLRPFLPETGYYRIDGEVEETARAGKRGIDRFQFAGEDIRADWSRLNDVEVLAFHSWSMSRLPIESVDPTTRQVRFFGSSPSGSSWGKFTKGNRYRVENVKEALRHPGQWYLDREEGVLTYLPKPGEDPKTASVIAPRLERLVVIQGNLDQGQFVTNLLFEGITIAHAAWPIPKTGQAVPQAEMNLDGAISATGARDVVFAACVIRHVGAYAMAFGPGCRDNRVERCDMIDLGAGGVKIGAAGLENWGALSTMAAAPEAMVSHHTVTDCTIAHAGRMHPAAIGVWIGHSPHNAIEHNEVFDLYYSATSIGWIWGYRPSHAHHNRIRYNHMHTLGQGVLSDMGAVYTLGISPGTVVSHNLIHDVHAFDYGGWGLYTDEGSTGVTMEQNIVYRTKTGGFHQHYGRDNRIVNNLFAFSQTDQLQRSRVEDHISFIFRHNIVLYDRGELMGKLWADDKVVVDDNLYWNLAGPVRFPGGTSLEAWRQQSGHDLNSSVTDPGFADPARADFRLSPGGAAERIGFVPIDLSRAGPRDGRRRVTKLPEVPRTFE